MLTDRQLMWFDQGERSSLEEWYGEGNRGRPWGKVVALDTQRTRKVAEATSADLLERTHDVAMTLGTMPKADAILLTFVGMTLVPDVTAWHSQKAIQEMFLNGAPEADKAGRALFTIGTDEHGFFYTVISRFEVDRDGKIAWKGRYTNCLPEHKLSDDRMVRVLGRAVEEGQEARESLRKKATEKGVGLSEDMENSAVAVAMAHAFQGWGIKVKLRDCPDYKMVYTMLADAGVEFYEESRGDLPSEDQLAEMIDTVVRDLAKRLVGTAMAGVLFREEKNGSWGTGMEWTAFRGEDMLAQLRVRPRLLLRENMVGMVMGVKNKPPTADAVMEVDLEMANRGERRTGATLRRGVQQMKGETPDRRESVPVTAVVGMLLDKTIVSGKIIGDGEPEFYRSENDWEMHPAVAAMRVLDGHAVRKFEVTEGFAEVVDAGSAAVLIMLYVRPEARGSGVGGQLLKAVLDTADSEGKPLALQVAGSCGQEHGLTDEQLIGWYGRNGFVHDDRYQHPGRMIREPRNSI